jgi:hypothetical protein
MVLLHTAATPLPLEWAAYLTALGATLAASRQVVHVYIATDGGAPSAVQRKDLAETVERGPVSPLNHIFTTDPFVRGIVTAFGWIAKARAVAHLPGDLQRVCLEIGHSPGEVMQDFARVEASFQPIRMLSLMNEGFVGRKRA